MLALLICSLPGHSCTSQPSVTPRTSLTISSCLHPNTRLIFKSLGIRCVPFLDQIVPYLLQVARKCGPGLRESLLQQLSLLTSIVHHNIAPFLPTLFDIIRDYWSEHQEHILTLGTACLFVSFLLCRPEGDSPRSLMSTDLVSSTRFVPFSLIFFSVIFHFSFSHTTPPPTPPHSPPSRCLSGGTRSHRHGRVQQLHPGGSAPPALLPVRAEGDIRCCDQQEGPPRPPSEEPGADPALLQLSERSVRTH